MSTWSIHRQLKKLSKNAQPSQVFVSSLSQRFQSVPLSQVSQSVSLRSRLSNITRSLTSKAATLASCVVILGITSTGAYAYTSDNVLPGSPLYPIRESVEQIEYNLAMTKDAQTRVLTKHLHRRLQENRHMVERHVEISPARMNKVLNNLEHMVDTASITDTVKDRVEEQRNNIREQAETELQEELKTQKPQPALEHLKIRIEKMRSQGKKQPLIDPREKK